MNRRNAAEKSVQNYSISDFLADNCHLVVNMSEARAPSLHWQSLSWPGAYSSNAGLSRMTSPKGLVIKRDQQRMHSIDPSHSSFMELILHEINLSKLELKPQHVVIELGFYIELKEIRLHKLRGKQDVGSRGRDLECTAVRPTGCLFDFRDIPLSFSLYLCSLEC